MGREIERKFLVRDDSYKRLAYDHIDMVQGYICRLPGRTVRVRIADGVGILTIKGPSFDGGLSRFEFNQEIPLHDAEDLMGLCTPSLITKTRHLVRSGKHIVEVDEFFQENAGLVVAEIELEYEEEPYEKPAFLGDEVTGQKRYSNASLTERPYCYWDKG